VNAGRGLVRGRGKRGARTARQRRARTAPPAPLSSDERNRPCGLVRAGHGL